LKVGLCCQVLHRVEVAGLEGRRTLILVVRLIVPHGGSLGPLDCVEGVHLFCYGQILQIHLHDGLFAGQFREVATVLVDVVESLVQQQDFCAQSIALSLLNVALGSVSSLLAATASVPVREIFSRWLVAQRVGTTVVYDSDRVGVDLLLGFYRVLLSQRVASALSELVHRLLVGWTATAQLGRIGMPQRRVGFTYVESLRAFLAVVHGVADVVQVVGCLRVTLCSVRLFALCARDIAKFLSEDRAAVTGAVVLVQKRLTCKIGHF